jgi:hypothetical protein
MEMNYNGIYRGRDHYNEWLFYGAKSAFPGDALRREAMYFMLVVACNPIAIPSDWHGQLKRLGWRGMQIGAMAPFASFHASRVTVGWQAASARATHAQADNEDLWSITLPDEELW